MYLKELTELNGVSGNEENVKEFIRNLIKDKVEEIWEDRLGNLIALKRGKGKGKILLDAHMDEVGFMVTNINEDGTLSFAPVGGVDPRVVIGKKVYVGKDNVEGIIGYKAVHLQRGDYLNTPKYSELKIDIGAKNKQEAEKSVKLGDYVAFATKYEEVGEYAIGKAFDDRGGCSILIDLVLEGVDSNYDIYFAWTVQEETGLRGPAVIAEQIKADKALAIETTTSGDDPELEKALWSTHLGDGPAITFMHSGYVVDKEIFETLVKVAQENKIPYQHKMRTVGGTNARRYALTGIPAGVVSIPARYIHSPVSMINLKDYENTKLLVRKYLESL